MNIKFALFIIVLLGCFVSFKSQAADFSDGWWECKALKPCKHRYNADLNFCVDKILVKLDMYDLQLKIWISEGDENDIISLPKQNDDFIYEINKNQELSLGWGYWETWMVLDLPVLSERTQGYLAIYEDFGYRINCHKTQTNF